MQVIAASESQAVLKRLVEAWKGWLAAEDETQAERAKSTLGTAVGDIRAIARGLDRDDSLRAEIVAFNDAWREFGFRGGAAENNAQRRSWHALQNAYGVLEKRLEAATLESDKPRRVL